MAKSTKANKETDNTAPPEEDTAQRITVSRRPMLGKDEEEESKDDALLRTEKSKRTVIKPIEDTVREPVDGQDLPSRDELDSVGQINATKDNNEKPEENTEQDTTDVTRIKISEKKDDKKIDENEKPENVEAAEEEFKRKSQLQEYIDSKQYFVPINQVTAKKNIRRSLWLTFIVIILSIVLLDLSLDSGAIYLVQKLPHTHFFSVRDQLN